LLSSDSLKIMYLYFLDSFKSLYADMHSWDTVALEAEMCQRQIPYRMVAQRRVLPGVSTSS
jgi:hypothetical protein